MSSRRFIAGRANWKLAIRGVLGVAALVVGTLTGCGEEVRNSAQPQSDRPGYNLVFFQNFDTPAPLGTFLTTYEATFTAYPFPFQDTSRSSRGDDSGYYDPAKTLSVVNGNLDSWLHYDAGLGKYLVSAVLPKLPTMTSGQFVLRMRADRIPGYKVVPLLWPDSDKWPQDGEIDFPEGVLDGSHWMAHLHFAHPAEGQRSFSSGVDGSQWHEYEIDWSADQVAFLVDGKLIGASTHGVPKAPMHWIFQFETNPDGPAPPTDAQGHVLVDWAKVYQLAQ